ncbi:hypothetical protein KP509_03G038200 [Ceratopteris richardii]|uniref:Calcineurin-like phosphoesterase domain-containing protein n=1 Tax=Ceratopteris richardii TaxID=49495 RepID=A0A8T2V6Q9_CERRI|nr:hypothetical protein KP509_03G038200 [Ceratopteris richardii]
MGLFFLFLCAFLQFSTASPLRFNSKTGQFKILQVADMHYANGAKTSCLDVLSTEYGTCSDLNTTTFINRLIDAEKPDLIVFTGDNIFGADCDDSAASQVAAFAPAVNAHIPWAAVLGNHDQEGDLDRFHLMQHIVSMDYSVSQINPPSMTLSMSPEGDAYQSNIFQASIDGYGNYHLKVSGPQGSSLSKKSMLNLFFLDSGDYSTVDTISGYGWIKASQQFWFSQTAAELQAEFRSAPHSQNTSAPSFVYFHIPVREFVEFGESNMTGIRQEGIGSSDLNSGFFSAMVEAGVKAAFVGHDHVNDFCGRLNGVNLCYGGGFGYHAYGLAGWPRRARFVLVSLGKGDDGEWSGVQEITTWKRLDDDELSIVNKQLL